MDKRPPEGSLPLAMISQSIKSAKGSLKEMKVVANLNW